MGKAGRGASYMQSQGPVCRVVGITNQPAQINLEDNRLCELDWLAAPIVSC